MSNGKQVRSNRVAYELTFGPIPNNLQALHQCDNPPCCNPFHIFLGTHLDNMDDIKQKGRWPKGTQRVNAKLNEAQVIEMRIRHAKGDVSQKDLAIEYGISAGIVSQIILRNRWKHV